MSAQHGEALVGPIIEQRYAPNTGRADQRQLRGGVDDAVVAQEKRRVCIARRVHRVSAHPLVKRDRVGDLAPGMEKQHVAGRQMGQIGDDAAGREAPITPVQERDVGVRRTVGLCWAMTRNRRMDVPGQRTSAFERYRLIQIGRDRHLKNGSSRWLR